MRHAALKSSSRISCLEVFSVPKIAIVALLVIGMLLPVATHARQLFPEPERILSVQDMQGGASFVINEDGHLFYRSFSDLMFTDGSDAPVSVLKPADTFDFDGEEYTFNDFGTFAQAAIFYIMFSRAVLVRAMITLPGSELPTSGFLVVSPDGTVQNVFTRQDFGEDVNATSQFGLCSGIAHDVEGTEHTAVGCVLPGATENSYTAVIFGAPAGMPAGPGSSFAQPMEGAYPISPADMHWDMLVLSLYLMGVENPMAFVAETRANSEAFDADVDRLRWGFRVDPYAIGSGAYGMVETTGPIGTRHSTYSHPIGGAGMPVPSYVSDVMPRRATGPESYIQSTAADTPQGTRFFKGYAFDAPIFEDTVAEQGEASEGQRECDCSLLEAFEGDMAAAEAAVSGCYNPSAPLTPQCEGVNFAGGDSINDDDIACFAFCRLGIARRDTEDIPVHTDIRIHLTASGDPIPVYTDLDLQFFLGLAGSPDGAAVLGLGGDSGEQVLIHRINGQTRGLFRSGDDFGHGALGTMSTGGFNNINASGQFAVGLFGLSDFEAGGLYLFTPQVDVEPIDPLSAWILHE